MMRNGCNQVRLGEIWEFPVSLKPVRQYKNVGRTPTKIPQRDTLAR